MLNPISLFSFKKSLILIVLILRHTSLAIASEEDIDVSSVPSKISISTGVTYLDFNQTFSSGSNRNLSFESLDIPNFSVLFETLISESSFIKINFLKYTPSTTDSNTSTAVGQKTLGISSLGIDFNYLPLTSSSRNFFKKMGVIGGFQFSSLPLLKRTSPTTVDGETFWYTFLRFGILNSFSLSEKLSLSTNFAYQLPLSSLAEYKLTTPSFLEAELLLTRLLNETWSIGLGWQFKKQSYEVSGTKIDTITNQPFLTQQSNFYSILYLQTNYSW